MVYDRGVSIDMVYKYGVKLDDFYGPVSFTVDGTIMDVTL